METAFKKLSSTDPSVIIEGIKEISRDIEVDSPEMNLQLLVDALTSLFYIDTFDRPDLNSAIREAQKIVAGLGPVVIPIILEKIKDSDIKAELAFAQTCGLMGEKAIEPLMDVFQTISDPAYIAFAMYAFGKIKSPRIKQALPLVLKAVQSPSKELEDTAVRALGKICESILPTDLSDEEKEEIIQSLMKKCSHSNEVIRSKAIRGLGKLIKYRFTNPIQKKEIETLAKGILGLDEDREWDQAYLVRREAQEVLEN